MPDNRVPLLSPEMLASLDRHRAESRASLIALERSVLPTWFKKAPDAR